MESKEILEVLNFRHACKIYDDQKKISKEDFNCILEAGRLSPSAFSLEPWSFVVIQNKELREKIKPVCFGAASQLDTASHFVIILARKKESIIYNSDYVDYYVREIQKLSIEKVEKKKKTLEHFQKNEFNILESDRVAFEWSCRESYIALGNMMFAAALRDIDSCGMEGFSPKELEKILEEEGIIDSKEFGVSCLVSFGYRKEEPKRAKVRRPMEQVVKFID